MAQALYRKWRSQSFGELVGQEQVTRTLRNAVAHDRISHAYLFCGPRGTGKTSTGRIFAKAINCLHPVDGEPDNTCSICVSITEGRLLDLVEIDAASNRGIDEIRDLRDKIRFSPNEARYKVYIVDEVHMLTDQAFNALLKTLEEPPPHAVFILATTEAHKLPATIISRCQRFDFRRIRQDAALGRLHEIVEGEQIETDDRALGLIIRNAAGSLRDAENLLDQIVSFYGNAFGEAEVAELLGLAGDERSRSIATAALTGDLTGGLIEINAVAADGIDLRQFNREVVETLRRVMLIQSGAGSLIEASDEERSALDGLAASVSPTDVVRVTRLFSELDLRNEALGTLPIEMALFDAVRPAVVQQTEVSAEPRTIPSDVRIRADAPAEPRIEKPAEPLPEVRQDPKPAGDFAPTGDLKTRERDLLRRINRDSKLKLAFGPGAGRFTAIEPDRIEFVASAELYASRYERRRAEYEQLIAGLFGRPVTVVYHRGDGSPAVRPAPAVDAAEDLVRSEAVQHLVTNHGATIALERSDS